MAEPLSAKDLDELEQDLILSETWGCDCAPVHGGLCNSCHHAHEIVEAGADLIAMARRAIEYGAAIDRLTAALKLANDFIEKIAP